MVTMSIDYVSIKKESDNRCRTFQNDESAEDWTYTKQALDLSYKNRNNFETINKPKTPEIQPEFVSIKMEVNIDDTIKEEPKSDTEEDSNTLKWFNNKIFMSTRNKHVSVNNERLFQIEIKKEPIEEVASNQSDQDSHELLVEKINQPTPSREDEEGALCQNSTVDGKYMCPICQKRFANKGNVQRHRLLHTRVKLVCTICSRTFIKEGQLKRHILSHSIVKTYECQECGKLFKSSSNLDQHKKIHLEVKPHECEICLKQFAVRSNLLKHQGKSRCKKPTDQQLECHICSKVFKRPYLLRSHLRKHTTEKPFTCEICNMKFKYKSTLIRHIQLHNDVKPFSCKICMKKFTHAGLIKPHMRKHTGEKPYPCPICSKMFAHKHNMERHTLRHAKIKHLDCEICHKKFPKESRLKYHMRIHTNEKPFPCKICPKKFSHKQNAMRHYTRKHPGETYDDPKTDASVAQDVWNNIVVQNNGIIGLCDMKIRNSVKLEQLDCVIAASSDEYVLP